VQIWFSLEEFRSLLWENLDSKSSGVLTDTEVVFSVEGIRES